MTEHLTQAQDRARSILGDLRRALTKADPVAGIILLKLIEQAVTLERSIDTLRSALEEAKHGAG